MDLVQFDPELCQVPGASYLGDLDRWVREGGAFPHGHSEAPNHYGLAVTLLLQITQYTRWLGHLGNHAHSRVLKSLEAGGIQGFCSGFLSSIAVASAETETDLGSTAAVALRLAVCVGAYVDHDGMYSQTPEEYSCVAVRWKEVSSDGKAKVAKVIQSFSNVRHISS